MRFDSIAMILVSSLAMAAGSFLFGNLPLVIQLSESNLNYISTFGGKEEGSEVAIFKSIKQQLAEYFQIVIILIFLFL